MWKGATSSVSVVSNIVPKGIETLEGGGTLSINVLDSLAAPLSGAEIHITNDALDPPINITTYTNADGRASFPGAPESAQYSIVVTKSGYSTAQTYEADATNVNPAPPPATVIEGSTTQVTFQIDLLSEKTVLTFEDIKDESPPVCLVPSKITLVSITGLR
jgi:hypothetical protein